MWKFFPNSFEVFEDFINQITASVIVGITNAINDGQITAFNTIFAMKIAKEINIITIKKLL